MINFFNKKIIILKNNSQTNEDATSTRLEYVVARISCHSEGNERKLAFPTPEERFHVDACTLSLYIRNRETVTNAVTHSDSALCCGCGCARGLTLSLSLCLSQMIASLR